MAKVIKDISKTQGKVEHRIIEQTLGAREVKIKIDTRRNPISLFQLRQFFIDRLIASGGRPKLNGAAKKRNKVPLLEDDWIKLKSLAEYYKKKDGISVSPGQIASAIVHSFISNIDSAEYELSVENNLP